MARGRLAHSSSDARRLLQKAEGNPCIILTDNGTIGS
jgi:hypothetical protein